MTRKTRPPGDDSRGAEIDHRAGRIDMPRVAPASDIMTETWLRGSGHTRAANERLRTMRTARVRLDRILYGDRHPRSGGCWECPGMLGDDGTWQAHCRGDAA